jgi:hypothetical protein
VSSVDSDNGGMPGMLASGTALLRRLNEDTVIVTGLGPIATYADLKRYGEVVTARSDSNRRRTVSFAHA